MTELIAISNCFNYRKPDNFVTWFSATMFEIYIGDVVYYKTPDQTLAKDRVKSIVSQKDKGRTKHIYLLCNGLSKLEGDLFLSLERAKAHFERCKVEITIPNGLANS